MNIEDRQMEQAMIERLTIRETIENWAVWRDAGDWERFATLWHPDGRIDRKSVV